MSQTRENPCDLLPSTIEMCLVLDMQLIIQRIAARWVTSFKDPFDEPCLLFFFSCPPTNIFLIVWQNSPRVSHCYMQMISMRVGPKHLHKQKRTCSLKSSAQKNCKLRPQNNHRCKKNKINTFQFCRRSVSFISATRGKRRRRVNTINVSQFRVRNFCILICLSVETRLNRLWTSCSFSALRHRGRRHLSERAAAQRVGKRRTAA